MELEIGKVLVIASVAIISIMVIGFIFGRIPAKAVVTIIGSLSLLLGFLWLINNIWGLTVEVPDELVENVKIMITKGG